ncbi:trace amine-associated receptor 13c-like [Amia ocellicauda]|uniref:trace amine-associated receptor 13c-like n=1 Tax=Amia ocellicauda TaxID=2972642 RepID=UPI003463D1ED
MNSSFIQMDSVEYCYENVTKSCIKLSRSVGERAALYFLFVPSVFTTIAGNLVVIISISHFKQLHSPNNLLVLSLAIADFLLGLFVLPLSMIRMVETCWYMGSFFCKLHTSVDILLCTTSIFHLCLIAIDRYYAVCEPLRYANKINIRVAWICITLGWVLPAIYSFGVIYTKSNDRGLEELVAVLSCEGGCLLIFNKLWALLDAVTFFIPCFGMIGIYTRIYTVARKQARLIQTMEDRTFSLEDNRRRAQRNKEQKAAKTLGIVMGVFLVCWVPYFTDTMIDVYLNFVTPAAIFDVFIWFGYINSTFNPLIYAFFYPWFRKALKLIVTLKIFYPNSSRIKLYTE